MNPLILSCFSYEVLSRSVPEEGFHFSEKLPKYYAQISGLSTFLSDAETYGFPGFFSFNLSFFSSSFRLLFI